MTRTFHLIVRCPFCVLRKWGFTMNFIQYIKQVWKAGTSGGTPLSPDRLNHMEDGIKNNNSMISELNNNNITNNICTNLLNPTLKTSSQNGITCTNNGDGTYTLNGTASNNAVFILQSNIEIASGKYKLTGCPQGGSTTSFKLDFEYKGNSTGIDYGNGSIINKTSNDIFKYLRIVVYTGAILNNAVFKPMLTTNLSATYNDFVPYTGNTGRLNADVALLRNNLGNNIATIVPSTYDDGNIFQKDFLNVNLSNKYNSLNLSCYFKIPLGTSSQYKNLPSSAWTNTDVYGLRKVFFFEKNIVGVEVIEFFPVPGKRYCNMYIGANSKYWTGWKAYLPV